MEGLHVEAELPQSRKRVGDCGHIEANGHYYMTCRAHTGE
jgi:hypothetical protein